MSESQGFYIAPLLREIRDGRVCDWKSLRAFQRAHLLRFIDWGTSRAGEAPAVISLLQRLQWADLVEVSGIDLDRGIRVRTRSDMPEREGVVLVDPDVNSTEDDSRTPPAARAMAIAIAPIWPPVQNALSISLTLLAEVHRWSALVAVPSDLPEAPPPDEPADVFVMMPFRSDMRPLYDDHIAKVCRRLSLSVSRADDLFAPRAVMADVWGSIRVAEAIVADCTDRNPNVFYEIGLAHALGSRSS